MSKEELIIALTAIAEGYGIETYDDRFIVVDNPNVNEPYDDPSITIDIDEVRELLKDL